MLHLNGTLTCKTAQDAELFAAHMPDHIALSRAEPGCLKFEVTQVDALTWRLSETFTDRAAFEAHGTRTAASAWASVRLDVVRDFQITED